MFMKLKGNSRSPLLWGIIVSLLFHGIVLMTWKSKEIRELLPAKKDLKRVLEFSLSSDSEKKSSFKKYDARGNLQDQSGDGGERNARASVAEKELRNIKKTYEGEILRKIEAHKYYPRYARRRKFEDTVTLTFLLERNGSIGGKIVITEPSAHEILNKGARETIRRAAPFGAFPREVTDASMTIEVTLRYDLEEQK